MSFQPVRVWWLAENLSRAGGWVEQAARRTGRGGPGGVGVRCACVAGGRGSGRSLVGDVAGHAGEELQGVGGLRTRGGSGGLVGVVGDGACFLVVRQATERRRIASAVTGEPEGERHIVGRGPDAVVHVEARMRPGEHALRRVAVYELPLDEHPEHRAAERLGERGDGRDVDRPLRHHRGQRAKNAAWGMQIAEWSAAG
jgi:hypothetical protein